MLRVVQWATGFVGKFSLTAMIEDPDLEVVGVRVYSDDKHGKDAGEICGLDPIGVKATKDRDEILALDADCVVYMADAETNPMGGLDDICDILASGKNVVSTAVSPLIFPAVMGPEAVQRMEKACAEGNSSFHGTGFNPGWASGVLPLSMLSCIYRLDSIRYQEILNYAHWDNAEMLFNNMGFGQGPDYEALWTRPEVMGAFFHAPLSLIAAGIDATIDRFEYDRQTWLAKEDFDIAAGTIKAGTVAAMKFSATAVVNGKPMITGEHVTRLRADAAPEWPDGRGFKLMVEGSPSLMVEAKIDIHGDDEANQACLATAMHAVHSIAPVCAAEPGIRTILDFPMVVGRHVADAPNRPLARRV